MWSLSNAFTSAFKELEPIPQYKATAKLAGFLQSVRPCNPHRKCRRTVPESRELPQLIGELGQTNGPCAAHFVLHNGLRNE